MVYILLRLRYPCFSLGAFISKSSLENIILVKTLLVTQFNVLSQNVINGLQNILKGYK